MVIPFYRLNGKGEKEYWCQVLFNHELRREYGNIEPGSLYEHISETLYRIIRNEISLDDVADFMRISEPLYLLIRNELTIDDIDSSTKKELESLYEYCP